jgi:tetratricopeptide (TPR) repeat protein
MIIRILVELIPPMVGRDKELEILYCHLGKALQGQGGLILISGEAGIGKTRILNKLKESAVNTGFFTVWGGCVPGIPLPYLPFQDAFSYFSRGPIEDGNSEKQTEPRDPTSVLIESLELLVNESAKKPLLICLEDLHWADSATIQLLIYLARNAQRLRLLMAGTYRPEDLTPGADGEVHPLLSGIRLMTREGTITELPLTRIGQEDLSQAIGGMLGATDQEVVESIHKKSGGNPLFAVETLRMLISEGCLRSREGVWSFDGGIKVTIPKTIQEVILRRMERLSKHQLKIIECASVIGESFDPSLIAESLGIDELDILDELDSLSKNNQLVAWNENGFNFTHAMVKDVTYENISKSKQKELHKRIGCALENRLPDNTILSSLSWNFFQAQEREKCIRYSILAGEFFLQEGIFPEAIEQYKRALNAIPAEATYESALLMILEGIGDTFRDCHSNLASSNFYDRFLHLSNAPKDIARVQRKQAENWLPSGLGKGDATHSLSLLDEAESCIGQSPEDIANIEHVRAWNQFQMGDFEKSAASLKHANDLMESTGKEWKLIDPIMLDFFILQKRLIHDEVLEKAKLFLHKAKESGSMRFQLYAEWIMADSYLMNDREDLALLHFRKCGEMADRTGDLYMLASCYLHIAEIEDELGNYLIAESEAEIGFNTSMVVDDVSHLSWSYALLGRTCLHNQEIEEAERCLIIGWGYVQQTVGSMRIIGEGDWFWSKAELELELGHDTEGFDSFEKAITRYNEAGSFFWYLSASCRYIYAKALKEQGLKTRAREQLDRAFETLTILKRFTLRNKVEQLRSSL